MEVIAILRVASIVVVYIITSLCYLAGSTHKLLSQMVDCCFIIITKVQSFIAYMTFYQNYGVSSYLFHRREEGNVVGSLKASDFVLSVGEAIVEVLWSTKAHNNGTCDNFIQSQVDCWACYRMAR